MGPKLKYPYITCRKTTFCKSRLCSEVESFPHPSKILYIHNMVLYISHTEEKQILFVSNPMVTFSFSLIQCEDREWEAMKQRQRGTGQPRVSPCWNRSGSSLLWPGPTQCNSHHVPLRTGFLDQKGVAPEQTPHPHVPDDKQQKQLDKDTPRNEKERNPQCLLTKWGNRVLFFQLLNVPCPWMHHKEK